MKTIALALTLMTLIAPSFSSANEDTDPPTLITVKSDRGGASADALAGIATQD